jgi:hypothetical protein
MKKTLLPILMLLAGFTYQSKAQTIPNAGFESWYTDTSNNAENPSEWWALNLGPSILSTITKSTDKQEGNYAAKMTPTNIGQAIPAVMNVSFAATSVPHYLNFYCKATVSSSDTFLVWTTGNDTTGAAGAGAVVNSNINAWAPYYLDLNGLSVGGYDTVEIGFYLTGTSPVAFVDHLTLSDSAIGTVFGTPMSGLQNFVKNQNNGLTMNIYPNPVQSEATIDLSIARASELKIVVKDLTGRDVQSVYSGFAKAGKQQLSIDASGLNNGIYFITATSGDLRITKKLIVNK